MTVDEFDIQFDILYNNISSNAAPGLDAYEKSVFLSQAHKDIVVELYNGRSIPGISFESTEEARAYLKDYINIITLSGDELIFANNITQINDKDHKLSDVLFRVNEYIKHNDKTLQVVPIRHDDLDNILKNPFRGPSKDRILRLDDALGFQDSISRISLYSIDNISNALYYITYICKPKPIILKGITDSNLTIDGVLVSSYPNGDIGNAPEILHSTILKLAVALAKQAYIGQ